MQSQEGLKHSTVELEKTNSQLSSKMDALTEECWKRMDEYDISVITYIQTAAGVTIYSIVSQIVCLSS